MASQSWGDVDFVVPQQIAQTSGEYDCKFVETPPDKLVCQILSVRYLKDDCLYFQIEVEADEPEKPWLTCTV